MTKKLPKKIEYEKRVLKITEIKPHPKNPKDHWVEGIRDSIKGKGMIEMLVVDEKNTLLAGHGRLKVLKEEGVESIEVIIARGLTSKEKEDYLLSGNKISERGGWDMEKLFDNYDVEDILGGGFNENELGDYWDKMLEIEDDGFNLEKAIADIKKPKTITGDLYALGNHRLMCGDSTNLDDIAKLVEDETMDMIYCDPPYNIGLDYSKGFGTSTKYRKSFPDLKFKGFKDNKKLAEYKDFIGDSIRGALSVSKANCHIFYWCDQNYIFLMQDIFSENAVKLRRVCIWIKNQFNVTPQIAFNKVYEPCIYGTVGKPHLNKDIRNLNEIINKEVGSGNEVIDDIMDIMDIWLVKRDPANTYEHPTQKPVTLNEKPIRRCTKFNDNILDLFGGSGSTLIAAEQLKRRSYLMEIDPVFCDVIIKRYERLTNKKVKKINGKEKTKI